MVTVDIPVLVVFFATVVLVPWLPARVVARVGRSLDAMADRRRFAIVLVGALSLLANGLFAWRHGIPVPVMTDETSYLLGAETFAEGRLTNPPHPMWRHFETEGVIQKPTYQSKYPPAQSLVLAAGRLLTGHAIAGVWISLALASGALCWMLQAWVGARWAFLGALLAAISPAIVPAWGQSYWGGGVAMLGGALLFGAVRRATARPRPLHGWLVGAALAILANSRPWEGLIVVLFAGAGLLWPKLRDASLRSIVSATALPALLVVLPAGAWMGYYNHRVTKHVLEMPYQTWYRTYVGGEGSLTDLATQATADDPPPRFVRGSGPRHLDDAEFKATMERQRAKKKTLMLFHTAFYVPGALALALVGLPVVLRDRWMRLALASIAAVLAAVFSTFSSWAPHYSAPVTPLVYAVIAAGLATIAGWSLKGRHVGSWVAAAIVASLLFQSEWEGRKPVPEWEDRVRALDRERIVRTLEETSGKHLVMVRYADDRRAPFEMVRNAADIDAAKVVWARELGPERNRALLRYYRDRKAWLVVADDPVPLALRDYPRPPKGAP